jgi:hypothetical protein
MVPGNGTDGEALALNLPPIATNAPAWWNTVQPTLPSWARDSSSVRWPRKGYTVIARPTNEGESLAMLLSAGATSAAEWPVATVPAPADQLIALDAPPISETLHAALARAFDASKALEGAAQTASRVVHAPKRAIFRPVNLREPSR